MFNCKRRDSVLDEAPVDDALSYNFDLTASASPFGQDTSATTLPVSAEPQDTNRSWESGQSPVGEFHCHGLLPPYSAQSSSLAVHTAEQSVSQSSHQSPEEQNPFLRPAFETSSGGDRPSHLSAPNAPENQASLQQPFIVDPYSQLPPRPAAGSEGNRPYHLSAPNVPNNQASLPQVVEADPYSQLPLQLPANGYYMPQQIVTSPGPQIYPVHQDNPNSQASTVFGHDGQMTHRIPSPGHQMHIVTSPAQSAPSFTTAASSSSWTHPTPSSYIRSTPSMNAYPTELVAPYSQANPPLIRTTNLQTASSMYSTPHINGFHSCGMYVSTCRAAIHMNESELGHIASDPWTPAERQAKRRLVQLERRQDGSVIEAFFRVVSPETRNPNGTSISCIFWEAKDECFVTSVDTITLLEALVGTHFGVEEKNRIRRNLEGFRPDTISKNKPESEQFFKLIMAFPNPKPRNIEKDVKIFPWRILPEALKKIVGKYSASFATTATVIAPPPNMPSPSLPPYAPYMPAEISRQSIPRSELQQTQSWTTPYPFDGRWDSFPDAAYGTHIPQ